VTCREFRDLAVYLAFGDLPAEHRLRAEEHLRECPACAAGWRDYQEVTRLARQLAAEPLPPEVEARLRALLDALRQQGQAGGG
jgi:anti-sigma factor RsiW